MKILKIKLIGLVLIILAASCGSSDQQKKPTPKKNSKTVLREKKTGKEYSIKETAIHVNWTAFKFTDKVGVGGTFDEVETTPKNKSGSVEMLLSGAKINIFTSSINSKNEVRDAKLRTYFFEAFNTETIQGEIISARNGKGSLKLKMNGISREVNYSYRKQSDTVLLSTTVDLNQWQGEEALDILNKACSDLHTGTDGVSKLWSEVAITVQLPLTTEQSKIQSENLQLNEGEKWKINEEMKPPITTMQEIMKHQSMGHSKDHLMVAKELKKNTDLLISSCTMKGKSHQELHKWLVPHIQLVKNLAEAKDHTEVAKHYQELEESFDLLNEYFE
ncbi:MAG: YceI family protein [Vicingaceae bacterium]